MDTQTRRGLEVLAAALLLGLLGDGLLRAMPWGLNGFLWTLALAASALAFSYRWAPGGGWRERWWVLPLPLIAFLYLWRDAALLKIGTTAALYTALGLGVCRAQLARRDEPEIARQHGVVRPALRALLGFPRFIRRDIEWPALMAENRGQAALAAGRGVLIAAPVLLVFGVLLTSADAAFERLIANAMDVNLVRLPGHLLLTVTYGWLAGGFLRGLATDLRPVAAAADPAPPVEKQRKRSEIGITEAAVTLGLVNALFGLFVLVQLRYLFGGIGVVAETDGLTLASYARRGFFELAWVAALALPFLLLLHRLFKPTAPRHLHLFRGLAGMQIGLLLLILVSAAQRMGLYQSVYGLTELRVYVSAAILWLAVVLAAFALTVLRSRAEGFTPAALAAGLAVLLALFVVSPDALIARVNVARALEGKPFDARYATHLSADAVPVLLDALPLLRTADREIVARGLLDRWNGKQPSDWRLWNRGRALAERRVAAERNRLESIIRTNPPPHRP